MMNPHFTSELASSRQRDLLQEAERARMAREARMQRPRLGSRMLHSMQAHFFALHRRMAGRLDKPETSTATSQVVLSSDR
jgi:hypothetical protein